MRAHRSKLSSRGARVLLVARQAALLLLVSAVGFSGGSSASAQSSGGSGWQPPTVAQVIEALRGEKDSDRARRSAIELLTSSSPKRRAEARKGLEQVLEDTEVAVPTREAILSVLVEELTRASNEIEVATQVTRLRGAWARPRVRTLVADPKLPLHVLVGILGTLEVDEFEDPALREALLKALGRDDGNRSPVLDAFQKAQRDSHFLNDYLEDLRSTASNGHADPVRRAHVCGVVAALAQTADERRQAADVLISIMAHQGDIPGVAAAARAALFEVTFHEFSTAEEWRGWFDRYVAKKGGFGPAELVRHRINDANDLLTEEQKLAIEALVSRQALPVAYLASRFEAVRIAATQRLSNAAGTDARKASEAVQAIMARLGEEHSLLVKPILLNELGEILGVVPATLQKQVAEQLRAWLGEVQPLEVLKGAVLALRACGPKSGGGPSLGDLYQRLKSDASEDAIELRSIIISALFNLKEEKTTVVQALEDKAPKVRRVAAGSLGGLGGAGDELAARLSQETDPGVRAELVKALAKSDESLATTAVVTALLDVLQDPGEARVPALVGLLRALTLAQMPNDLVIRVTAQLVAVYPKNVGDDAARQSLLADLMKLRGPQLVPILEAWCRVETRLPLLETLVGVLTLNTPGSERLLALADELTRGDADLVQVERLLVAARDQATEPHLLEVQSRAWRLLALNWLARGLSAKLPDAETQITKLLEGATKKGPLRALRGKIRLSLAKTPTDALAKQGVEDLRAALSQNGLTAEEHLESSLLLTDHLLDTGSQGEADDILSKLPANTQSREFSYCLAKSFRLRGRFAEAYSAGRTGLAFPGQTRHVELSKLVLESGLELPDPPTRLGAAQSYDVLKKLGHDVSRWARAIEDDERLRTELTKLPAPEALRALEKLPPPRVAAWLVHDLPTVTDLQAINARLDLLKLAFPTDATLKALSHATEPSQISTLTNALSAWWTSLSKA